MRNVVKSATAGAALGGALFFTAGLGIANAQPQDGQVDLALGNAAVVEDVDTSAAAQIAAKLCDTDVAQVTQVAQSVDADGNEQAVCTNELGVIALQANQPGDSEDASGQAQSAPGQGEQGTQGQSDDAPAQQDGTGQTEGTDGQ